MRSASGTAPLFTASRCVAAAKSVRGGDAFAAARAATGIKRATWRPVAETRCKLRRARDALPESPTASTILASRSDARDRPCSARRPLALAASRSPWLLRLWFLLACAAAMRRTWSRSTRRKGAGARRRGFQSSRSAPSGVGPLRRLPAPPAILDSRGFREPALGQRRPLPTRVSPRWIATSSLASRAERPRSRRSMRRIAEFRACYRRGLVHDPAQDGRVAIVLRVGTDGSVSRGGGRGMRNLRRVDRVHEVGGGAPAIPTAVRGLGHGRRSRRFHLARRCASELQDGQRLRTPLALTSFSRELAPVSTLANNRRGATCEVFKRRARSR